MTLKNVTNHVRGLPDVSCVHHRSFRSCGGSRTSGPGPAPWTCPPNWEQFRKRLFTAILSTGSIPSTFYWQLLRLKIYTELNGVCPKAVVLNHGVATHLCVASFNWCVAKWFWDFIFKKKDINLLLKNKH